MNQAGKQLRALQAIDVPQFDALEQIIARGCDDPICRAGGNVCERVKKTAKAIRRIKLIEAQPVQVTIDPSLILAVEYGFKAAERGWNLEMTLSEFRKTIGD